MKQLLISIYVALLLTACAGQDGSDGRNGQPGSDAIVELLDPCGPSGGYDEVLLRFADRSLVAYFEQGSNRFLVKLSPGTYRTTDMQQCVFTIDKEMNVSWQ